MLNDLKVIKIAGIISTDDIIPAHYKHKSVNPKELAQHIFENRFPGLAQQIDPNSVLIADATFGIGSSREQAVSSLLAAGIKGVVAPRFGRIFFRNAWNLGMLALEVPTDLILSQNKMSIDLQQHQIILPNGEAIHFNPLPKELIEMYECGGILHFLKKLNGRELVAHTTERTQTC